MGSACCVAASGRTIKNGATSDLERPIQRSPSWSFRWDNRGLVVGEETSMNWLSDGVSRNLLDVKSQATADTACASEEGSPLYCSRMLTWQKSPSSEGNTRIPSFPPSDPSVSGKYLEVKESKEAPTVSELSTTKMSPSVHSISSLPTSPLSPQGCLVPTSLTPSRWAHRSPGHHLLRQVSDSRIPSMKSSNFSISEEGSPFMLPGWSNESDRLSSDGWSLNAFSELMATSHRERLSFDSESLSREKLSKYSGRVSSPSTDIQTCGVCSKLLTERCVWGSQKTMSTNELAVVAILICGHVYHAECLESMTPEVNRYDPACPVCTFGEKKVLKLLEKALRAEMDSKARLIKRSRSRVVDGDVNSDSFVLDRNKVESRGKFTSSSSMKKSSVKPLLKRYFSFGSKGSRSLSEYKSNPEKGFFWSMSQKERA